MKIAFEQNVVHWEAAATAVAAAVRWAEEAGTRVNVAVIDSGGNLAAFLRMPGAFLHSIEIAIKAVARTHRALRASLLHGASRQ